MRIVVIGAESAGLGAQLAAHLHLPHLHGVAEVTGDAFVIDGAPRDAAEARALDAILRARAAEVDAVLVLGAAPEDVVGHYHGRVVELEAADAFDSALAGLREVLLAA